MSNLSPTNKEIATLLDQIADLLEQRDDNPYRVQAFRHGAKNVEITSIPLTEIVEQGGGEALKEIEGIGEGLATTIFEYISTGRSSYLQQLQARQSPESLFQRVPGIGQKLAQRIAQQLEITSLEALEQAAHDGRLAQVAGFGPRRVAAVRHSLADLLRHTTRAQDQTKPPVALLLEVDAEYRQRAEAGELPRLTPRRFNPTQEAWLPIMRTEREGWTMSVLFSNTAQAHKLAKTHDWVVIYYQKDGPEAQGTVVTETSGPLKGKRVIRGREKECRQFYEEYQD
jgi:putative hydrolase